MRASARAKETKRVGLSEPTRNRPLTRATGQIGVHRWGNLYAARDVRRGFDVSGTFREVTISAFAAKVADISGDHDDVDGVLPARSQIE